MRVHIGGDHAAWELHQDLLEFLASEGHEVTDHGPHAYDAADDYPVFVLRAAEAVAADPDSLGIVLGGSGNGEQMAANKVAGIRAAKHKGKIAVLLPETTTSARYTSFDEPYHKKAFAAAGLKADQFIITNAQGSESTELTQAQSAISQGASVLVVDPISSGVGASIETYAKQHGVPVIDYDRLTLGGARDYYVSFDNVGVGTLIGKGMEQCLVDWKVQKPQILVMRGAPTDNNATLFA